MYIYSKKIICLCLFGVLFASDSGAQLDTMAVLQRSVEDYPLDDSVWQRFGRALFDREDFGRARAAFQKALEIKKTASAYTGLGKVYAAQGKGSTQRALQTFRLALGVEENYAPAQLEIARFHTKLHSHDAEAAYRRAIEMDPTFATPYQELILWYENAQLDWEKELVALCQTYITRWPDDGMGYYHLALIYVDRKLYDKVYRLAESAAKRFADDLSWIPMMAQAEAARGNPGRALVLFEQFLASAPEDERIYYEDLSLIATDAEIKKLAATPDSLHHLAHKQFWRTRSGAAMLGANARQAEHYRRVWHARNFFGRHQQPWDKRGEVYVRYGEPDYRSKSGRENAFPSVAVQQFKERKINQLLEKRGRYRGSEPTKYILPGVPDGEIYYSNNLGTVGGGFSDDGRGASQLAGNPEKPIDRALGGIISGSWLWEVRTPSGDVRLNLPLGMQQGIEPAAFFDRDATGSTVMPWESWVYLSVGNGREFTFTDQFMSGRWDFPLVPNLLWHLELVTEVSNSQPAVSYMHVSSVIPEKFTVPPGVVPLDFYYDLASFRGVDGQPRVEVYFGIPPDQIQTNRTGEFVRFEVAHELTLVNAEGLAVYHTNDKRVFQSRMGADQMDVMFVDVANLPAAPGAYTLGVKLADQLSGKWNLYQQEIVIPSFVDSLAVSDIELAWVVSETPRAKKFKKGDVWVVPEPTRKYGGNDVHLYYEIYNLTKDTFGQVKYRVDYTIRENVQNGAGVVGVLAGSLKRFFKGRQEPEFRVGYEQVGTEVDEPAFFELETEKLKPGLKEVVVTVTDLNANRMVSKEAVFWVGVLAK